MQFFAIWHLNFIPWAPGQILWFPSRVQFQAIKKSLNLIKKRWPGLYFKFCTGTPIGLLPYFKLGAGPGNQLDTGFITSTSHLVVYSIGEVSHDDVRFVLFLSVVLVTKGQDIKQIFRGFRTNTSMSIIFGTLTFVLFLIISIRGFVFLSSF